MPIPCHHRAVTVPSPCHHRAVAQLRPAKGQLRPAQASSGQLRPAQASSGSAVSLVSEAGQAATRAVTLSEGMDRLGEGIVRPFALCTLGSVKERKADTDEAGQDIAKTWSCTARRGGTAWPHTTRAATSTTRRDGGVLHLRAGAQMSPDLEFTLTARHASGWTFASLGRRGCTARVALRPAAAQADPGGERRVPGEGKGWARACRVGPSA